MWVNSESLVDNNLVENVIVSRTRVHWKMNYYRGFAVLITTTVKPIRLLSGTSRRKFTLRLSIIPFFFSTLDHCFLVFLV